MRERQPQRTMICPDCGRPFGDPLYTGPVGHAPRNVCLDCWSNRWDLMELRMLCGGDWEVIDSALWLLCLGFSHSGAADLLAKDRRAVHRWITRRRYESACGIPADLETANTEEMRPAS